MKKLTLIASSALLATSVFAGEIKVNGRFNYLHTDSKTNSASKVTAGNYTVDYLKVKNTAKFNDTTSGEVSLNLRAKNDTDAATRSFNNFVDTAVLSKAFGSFTVIAGKQPVLIGGRENDYSGRDIYTTSVFRSAVPYNQVGLTAQYSFMGHDFYIQHQENSDIASTTDKKITGVAFFGNLMDGMIKPILSYHKKASGSIANKDDKLMAAGVQFNHSNLTAEFDYLTHEQAIATGSAPKLTSMVFHVAYTHDMFAPFAKYIMETGKDSYAIGTVVDGTKNERTAFELGLNVVPNKDEDFRYHVVYSSSEKKEKTGGTDKVKENTLYAGLAFGLNILK